MSTIIRARKERAVRISLHLLVAALVAAFVIGFAVSAAADIRLPSSPIGQPPLIVSQRVVATPRPIPRSTPASVPARYAPASAAPQPKPAAVAPPSSSGPMAIGRAMAAKRGWVGPQWDALRSLWSRESGWSPSATNRSSGACGIPQRHPCNGLSSQPVEAQIAWGLDYIAGRYGSPVAAWGHFQARGWY